MPKKSIFQTRKWKRKKKERKRQNDIKMYDLKTT